MTNVYGEYQIESVLSTHSFDKYQMSVITCVDEAQNLFNGIAIFPIPSTMDNVNEVAHITANGLVGKPLPIQESQAIKICHYLESVLNGDFSGHVEFYSTGLNVKIRLKKFIKNYHGGGAYKGVMGYSNFSFLGRLPRVTISRNSLDKFRVSLAELYQLRDELDG